MDKKCEKCLHSHDCKGVYNALSKSSAASVTWRVITAFLLPMIVFIAILALLNESFTESISNAFLRDALKIIIAAGCAIISVLAVKGICRLFTKNENNCSKK